MRKVLSFVLVLALIMGSFSFAFASDINTAKYSDIAGKKCEGAVTVLSALGIVNGYTDGTYKPENIVTRAEMAKLLIVALGLDDYVAGTYTSFKDVGNHWANSYIAYAASMGIIEGYPDGTFRPDNTVTYQEAITMVVRALGYQDEFLTGTWPASHVSMAQALGILDDVKATAEGANRGDVAILIYNALGLPTVTYTTNGDLNDNGKPMVERCGGENQGEGILTKDGAETWNGYFDIADELDLSEYYGFYGTVYTVENDDDEDVIVALGDIKGTAYEVELGDWEFEYKDTKYTVDDYGVLIINDEATSGYNDKLIYGTDDERSMATVIADGSLKKSGTNLYAIIQWQVSDAVFVEDDDVEDIANNIEDEDDFNFCGTDYDVIYDDDDEAFDVTVEGAATELKALKENDVVFVYANSNDEVVKLNVARDTAKGTISKVNKDGDKFTVDGTAYELSAYTEATGFDIRDIGSDPVGDEFTFYLDPNGYIFVAESVDNMGDYALAIAYDTEESYGKTTASLKVMDNKGAVSELELKGTMNSAGDFEDVDFIYCDQTGFEYEARPLTSSDLSSYLYDGGFITYATNSAGKVTEIEYYDYFYDDYVTISKKGVLNGDVASDATVIFTKDSDYDWDDEDAFDVTKLANIAGEELGWVYYIVDDGDIVAMVVSDSVGTSNDSFGMINSYAKTKNADDDSVYEYDALISGKAATHLTDGLSGFAYESTEDGEFFIFDIDADGVVTDVTRVDNSMTVDEDDIDALAGTNWTEVTDIDKTAGWIELNGTKYSVDDSVTVYKMVLDNDDDFDSYAVGSFANVAKGAHVIGFDTTDDDEDMFDTFVVVTRADWAKLMPPIPPMPIIE